MNTHMGNVLTMIQAEKLHSFENFCFIVVRRLYQNTVDSRLKGQKVQVTGGLASCRNILSDIIKSVGNCRDILVQTLTFVTLTICTKPNHTDIFHAKITGTHREELSIIVIQKLLHISSLVCLCFSPKLLLKENPLYFSGSCWGCGLKATWIERWFCL